MTLTNLWIVTLAATVVVLIITRFPWVRSSIKAAWISITVWGDKREEALKEHSQLDRLFGYVYLYVFVTGGFQFVLMYVYLILVSLGIWEFTNE